VALMMAHGASQRRACRLAQINRNVLCYRPKLRPQDDRIRARLRELAEERRRFGYRRLYVLLRREGEPANRKRVYRIYREEKLMVRKRTRKRVAQARGRKRHAPSAPNQFWAMDFVSDVVAAGRRIPSLTVIDAYTRESLALEVDTSITGDRVVCVFEEIVERRGLREAIQVDNGPEFRGLVLDAWAYERSV
jgi:putative transposase